MLVLEEDAHVADNAAHIGGRVCDKVLVKVQEFGDGEVEKLLVLAAKAGHHQLPVRQTGRCVEHLDGKKKNIQYLSHIPSILLVARESHDTNLINNVIANTGR